MSGRSHLAGSDRITAWREARRSRRALDRAREPIGVSAAGDRLVAVTESPRRTTRQKVVLSALVTGVVLVGLLFVGPFPVRTWWAQRSRTQALERQVAVIEKANARLDAQANDLKDPATVARIARQNYGMVRQGERSYALLPPPREPVTLPAVWPFVTLETVAQPAGVPVTSNP